MTSPTSFKLQLVGLVEIPNIFCPPSNSKPIFIDEFADLLMIIAPGVNERFFVCGELNMAGTNATSIDVRLSSLLDTHGYQQHVTVQTRRRN
jgi:hypothetical protein